MRARWGRCAGPSCARRARSSACSSVWPLLAPARLRIDRREALSLIGYGIVGFAFVQWLYFVAIYRLPIGIGLLLEFTAPVLVALWARFVWRERVRDRVWLALGLVVVGLALVARSGRGSRWTSSASSPGSPRRWRWPSTTSPASGSSCGATPTRSCASAIGRRDRVLGDRAAVVELSVRSLTEQVALPGPLDGTPRPSGRSRSGRSSSARSPPSCSRSERCSTFLR